MKIRLHTPHTSVEATVLRRGAALEVRLDDGGPPATFTVTVVAPGQVVLVRDGRRWELWGAQLPGGEGRQLWVDGLLMSYERERAQGAALGAAVDTGLTATIPAIVREILVAAGQRVQAGEWLLLLESMKMVLPIAASRPGVVDAILCQEGDAVDPGVALIAFRPDEPAAT